MCAHVWGRERVRPHSGAVPSTRKSAGCRPPSQRDLQSALVSAGPAAEQTLEQHDRTARVS